MRIKDIKAFMWATAFGIFAMISLSACDTGTNPGDTNVERGEVRDEGELVEGSNGDPMGRYNDTASLEKHYEHADHEKHGDNKAGAVHDGTGKKGGVERDDINN